MAVMIQAPATNRIIEVRISEKLTAEDYKQFVPQIEDLIKKNGKLRILLEMRDFHGWSAGAIWEDLKFDLKHFKDIERLAVIGEKRWQEGMAAFCKPFTTAKIHYFDHAQIDEARNWLRQE